MKKIIASIFLTAIVLSVFLAGCVTNDSPYKCSPNLGYEDR